MSEYGAKIRSAYARTPECPGWDTLPLPLRLAFIQVYFHGQRDALDELARPKPRAAAVGG